MKRKNPLTEKDRAFYQGFAVAIATLARGGWPSQARDIMQTNGITLNDLRKAGVVKFDLEPLSRP